MYFFLFLIVAQIHLTRLIKPRAKSHFLETISENSFCILSNFFFKMSTFFEALSTECLLFKCAANLFGFFDSFNNDCWPLAGVSIRSCECYPVLEALKSGNSLEHWQSLFSVSEPWLWSQAFGTVCLQGVERFWQYRQAIFAKRF